MAITRRGVLSALLLLLVSLGLFIMSRTHDNRVVLRHHANGQALLAKGDYQGALRSYEQALERMIPSRVYAVSREQIEVDLNLARVRSLIAKAQGAMAEGKFAEAVEAYQQGLQQWRPESNYGLTRPVVEMSLREARISLLVQDAEAAAAAGDLVKFACVLNLAEELSPGDPRFASLRSAKFQDIDGRKYWVQAARNLGRFNLEKAEAALQIAEFVLPSCGNVAFARERLEALKAEERLCGQKPDYPLLYQALNSYLAQSDRSVHKVIVACRAKRKLFSRKTEKPALFDGNTSVKLGGFTVNYL